MSLLSLHLSFKTRAGRAYPRLSLSLHLSFKTRAGRPYPRLSLSLHLSFKTRAGRPYPRLSLSLHLSFKTRAGRPYPRLSLSLHLSFKTRAGRPYPRLSLSADISPWTIVSKSKKAKKRDLHKMVHYQCHNVPVIVSSQYHTSTPIQLLLPTHIALYSLIVVYSYTTKRFFV